MIDEELTFEKYGYCSTDWKPRSHKKIVVVCDVCGDIRYINKGDYRDLCKSCAQKRKKMPPRTAEHCHNMSKAKKGTTATDEARQHMSAGHQGIPYEEWDGFTKDGAYCEKFDEACRERIREKYCRKCFLCDKPETDNKRKLSVHHYDMNKDQGCNGNKWKLVPLCGGCHNKVHSKIWTTRIEYLLENVWD